MTYLFLAIVAVGGFLWRAPASMLPVSIASLQETIQEQAPKLFSQLNSEATIKAFDALKDIVRARIDILLR